MQISEGGEFPKEPAPGDCATWEPVERVGSGRGSESGKGMAGEKVG